MATCVKCGSQVNDDENKKSICSVCVIRLLQSLSLDEIVDIQVRLMKRLRVSEEKASRRAAL